MTMRLRFWLWMVDVTAAGLGFGSPLFYWAVERASDAIDWGQVPKCPDGKEPF